MKFVIKSGSVVKLFSGEMKIEALAQFLKENFADWNANNLYYVDAEGDRIMVRMQEDIDAMLAMNPHSQFLKLQFVEEKTEEKETENILQPINAFKRNQTEESSKRATKKQTESESDSKNLTYQSFKTFEIKENQKKEINEENSKSNYRSHKIEHKSSSENSSDSSSQRKIKMVEEAFNQQVAFLIDQRIKSLIPCLKNQINQQPDSTIKNQEGPKHEGITCNGCGKMPISGIRYKCLKCINFNLCEQCQEKIEHQHNLLKMKKPENEDEQTQNKKGGFHKIGRNFFKQLKRRNSSSHSHERDHSYRHGHWRGKGKHGFGCQERSQKKIKRKYFKLQKVFGQRPDLKEFILKNTELKGWQLIQLYAAQNKINQEELQQKMNKMRKQKLSAFYQAPENEFDEIVKAYPKLNFRQLIVKLKEQGLRTYSGQNFKKMRQNFRKQRRETSKEKEEEKSKKRSHSKKKEGKKSMDKYLKKELLKEMESLFGEENSSSYKDFIKQNQELGKEDIIAKWIEKIAL